MGRKILIGAAVVLLALVAWLAFRPTPEDQLAELVADTDVFLPAESGLDPFTGTPLSMERDGDALVLRAHPWDGIVSDDEHADDSAAKHGLVWRLPPR